MGLLKKLFGAGAAADTQPASSQFHESETTAQQKGSANAPRRELVQVALRDTMRKHGIPSDWMDCRILSVVTRKRVAGMHVQFIVSKGQTRLLEFVHSFQESFWEEIEKFEPRARDWLFSLAWQFDGPAPRPERSRPERAEWLDGDTQPPEDPADELRSDLQALYAIRDEALKQSTEQAARAAAPRLESGNESPAS
jgi:hypothetical protein